jgi:hypothetical protein
MASGLYAQGPRVMRLGPLNHADVSAQAFGQALKACGWEVGRRCPEAF